MNRHTRDRFIAEVEAYLAFWTIVYNDDNNNNNASRAWVGAKRRMWR